MTVWTVNTIGNESLGLFTTYDVAMASINFSYHKRHVSIETEPNGNIANSYVVHVTHEDGIDRYVVQEEPVHSSTVHL